MQQHVLAGFTVRPMPPIEVEDFYLDTADGALLREGLVLRLRRQDEVTTATLRPLESESQQEVVQERVEVPPGDVVLLPEGTMRAAVEESIGSAELELLLRFRQYRAPRALFEAERLAGVISLDIVGDQTDPQQTAVSNEVELELLDAGKEDDLRRVHAELLEMGLDPDVFGKFERGFFRRELRGEGRLLLLPAERRFLEQAAESESAVERRRASALLMAAAGEDDRTISRRVGLAPSRVRHWREAFRLERIRVFDEHAAEAVVEEEVLAPAFTVSEVVAGDVRVQPEPSGAGELEDVLARVLEHARLGPGGGDTGPWGEEPISPEHLPPSPEPPRSPPEPAEWERPRPELAPPSGGGASSEEPPREAADEWLSIEEPPAAGPPHAFAGGRQEEPHFERMALASDLSAAEAARRLLTSAAEAIDRCLEDLGSDAPGEAFAATSSSVARARLGVELAAGHLSQQQSRRLRAEAERLEEQLDQVALLHHAAESIDLAALEDLPPAERLALAMARTVWSVERRRAVVGMAGEPALQRQLALFRDRLLADADAITEAQHATRLLKHVLGSGLWSAYETVGAMLGAVALERDAAGLAGALAALEARLALIDAPAAHSAQAGVARARRALERYRRQHDLERRLGAFADEWLATGGAADPAALDQRREAAAAAAEESAHAFSTARDHLLGSPLRMRLGEATAAL